MKLNYVKQNIKPILIGFTLGILLINLFQLIENIIIKIALILIN